MHPSPFALVASLSLETLSEGWAYVTLAVSSILTEELAPLLGGLAAEQGHVQLAVVVAACATGVFLLSAACYLLGRWRAAWVRLKLRNSPPLVRKVLNAMRWNPWRSTFIARFVFGGRIALPLACGAAHVPPWIFFTGTAIASVVWAALLAGLGWAFGEAAVLVVGEVRKFEAPIAVVLVALGAGAWWWLRRRQRREGTTDAGGEE